MQPLPAPPSAPRRHIAKLVVSLILLGGFAWMLQRGGIPLVPSRSAFANVSVAWVVGYAALYTLTTWLRTYRWVYLLRPIADVRASRVIGIGLIGFTAILFAPLRMGEVVRPYLLSRRAAVTFTQAMGTVAAERIVDGLFVSAMLLVALFASHPLSPMPDHLGGLSIPVSRVPAATYATLAVFVSAFIAMGVFHWRRAFAERATLAVVGVVSKPLASWLTKHVEHVADGLGFLPDVRHSAPFFRDTTLYWLSLVAGTWALLRASGIHASGTEACVVMGVVSLGILIPAGPGFFGAYQLAAYTALAMYFPEAQVLSAGAAYVFLSYLIQILGSILGMLVGFWLDQEPTIDGVPLTRRDRAR